MKNLFMMVCLLMSVESFAAGKVAVKSAKPAQPKVAAKPIGKVPQAICLMDSRKNPHLQAEQLKAGCPKK